MRFSSKLLASYMIGLARTLFWPPLSSAMAAPPPPLSSYNWSVKASPSLAEKPPPVAAIRAFIVKVEGRDKGYESDVCSFRFVNLRRTGNLSLVLSLDDGGRGGCGQVTIIDRTASGYVGYDGAFTSAMGVDDVSEVVRDVNRDGKLYLVFDQQFATEGMWSMVASWPVIYGWDGSAYKNLSFDPRFRDFYRREQTEWAQSANAHDGLDDCTIASIDKVQRVLGDRDAGTEHAIAWAASDNAERRAFAADVLSDIGTAKARESLKRLAADPVGYVAGEASVYLRSGSDADDTEADALEPIDNSSGLDPSW